MADTKISGLPAVGTPAATDEHEVNQGGVSKRENNSQILNSLAPNIQLQTDGSASVTNLTVNPVSGLGAILGYTFLSDSGGYTANDVLTADADGAGNATFTVDSVDGGGSITGLSLINPGTSYVSASPVALSGGSGTGATISIDSTAPIVPVSFNGDTGNLTVRTVNSVRVYRALLTQSGTNPPVATILENTLGGVPVWTRDSGGTYRITLAGVFLRDKTFLNIPKLSFNDANVFAFADLIDASGDFIIVKAWTSDGESDNILGQSNAGAGSPIEILVYP